MAFSPEVRVGPHTIGREHPPFVIAEMSGNHNGDLDRALAIVDAVADSGAQALKIQTYTADTITIDVDGPAFRVEDGHGLWGGRTLHQLYDEAHTPWEWHRPIFDRARERGLVPFSSPFDPTAVELLEGLGVELYKTASAEIVDLPLIRLVAGTGKPIVMSTGMATMREIAAAVEAAAGAGCTDLVLLACTASYPADPADARLHNIALLAEAFGVPVGLSDHTLGHRRLASPRSRSARSASRSTSRSTAPTAASTRPSRSSRPSWRRLRAETEARLAGRAQPGPDRADRVRAGGAAPAPLAVRRRGRAGRATRSPSTNVRSIRPAGGLPPDAIATVLGRRFSRDVSRGHAADLGPRLAVSRSAPAA